jgi:hypothetical protein
MESSKSPRKVLIIAHRLGRRCLPAFSSRFSRQDFTLAQLFACLALRQFYNLSYRGTQQLLQDSPGWRRAIGLKRTPDHNTLCDASGKILQDANVQKMLDHLVQCFADAGLLKLDEKPLSVDASYYESRHISRYYERRRKQSESKAETDARRSAAVKSLPKMGLAIAAACHVILGIWVGTGAGADHPHLESVVFDAWRRAEVKTVVADAGYDSEKGHMLLRDDMGLVSYIPPSAGRPTDKEPATHYRAMMKRLFADGTAAKDYGQRWQSETANSMIKRNQGSFLRARSDKRREQEMLLKALVHNLAL